MPKDKMEFQELSESHDVMIWLQSLLEVYMDDNYIKLINILSK